MKRGRYQRARDSGRCTSCGREDSRTQAGSSSCAVCAISHALRRWYSRHSPPYTAEEQAYIRAKEQMLRDAQADREIARLPDTRGKKPQIPRGACSACGKKCKFQEQSWNGRGAGFCDYFERTGVTRTSRLKALGLYPLPRGEQCPLYEPPERKRRAAKAFALY